MSALPTKGCADSKALTSRHRRQCRPARGRGLAKNCQGRLRCLLSPAVLPFPSPFERDGSVTVSCPSPDPTRNAIALTPSGRLLPTAAGSRRALALRHPLRRTIRRIFGFEASHLPDGSRAARPETRWSPAESPCSLVDAKTLHCKYHSTVPNSVIEHLRTAMAAGMGGATD